MIYAKEENGKVVVYNSLPKDYPINGIRHNLSVLPIGTVNEQGFYELIVPTISQYQRLEPLELSDFNGSQWVQRFSNFTAQEIADYDEQQLEIQARSVVSQRETAGNELFYKVATVVKRRYDEGNLTQNQYKNIRTQLENVIRPLKLGDWDIAQDNINAISRPSGQMGTLYDYLKNEIDTYVTNNY